jgi:hypothetical protein
MTLIVSILLFWTFSAVIGTAAGIMVSRFL